jgi:hypothetical protein
VVGAGNRPTPLLSIHEQVCQQQRKFGNLGYSRQAYEGQMASVPLYRLFWNRVDYVLGKRPDWVTCDQADAVVAATNTNVNAALGGLCGPTSGGRQADPPDQLAPLPVVQAPPPPPTMVRPKRPAKKPSPPVTAGSISAT